VDVILIDITRLLYRQLTHTLPTGIDRVCIEYIRHYGNRSRAVLCLGPFSAMLSQADSTRIFTALLLPGLSARWLSAALIAKAVLWRWLRVPRRPSILINTSHTGLESPWYAWALRRSGARLVAMVHDLIPISHPEYCRSGEYAAHHVRMRSAATLAHGIVANSSVTLEKFTEFCEINRLPVPAATVALLAPGLRPAPLAGGIEDQPVRGPYFVILGTIEPRKNHWMLLHVWRSIVEQLGAEAPTLVVVGQRGWECENVVDMLERCRPLRGKVIELGRCSDQELHRYLRHASALLFPSFVEGYGMPLTEALAMNVPVIASDIPVFHEVAGSVPDYASPVDGKRWESLIKDYAQPDSAMRTAQLGRLRHFKPPTWAAHFTTVDTLLARLSNPG